FIRFRDETPRDSTDAPLACHASGVESVARLGDAMRTWTPPSSAPAQPHGRWEMFSALRYRNYRFYWLGQFPSVLAQNMQHVALAWLVLQLTNSPALLGITGLMQTIPNIALSFLGGALADRMDRK